MAGVLLDEHLRKNIQEFLLLDLANIRRLLQLAMIDNLAKTREGRYKAQRGAVSR